jgi:hypothetical protein
MTFNKTEKFNQICFAVDLCMDEIKAQKYSIYYLNVI